jgi:hypothetical protein
MAYYVASLTVPVVNQASYEKIQIKFIKMVIFFLKKIDNYYQSSPA